jgi:hypothetical protein
VPNKEEEVEEEGEEEDEAVNLMTIVWFNFFLSSTLKIMWTAED